MNVTILGLGLMGGSLGLALRERGLARVTGYARREHTREAALQGRFVDVCHATPADAVRDADVAVFCTPVLTIPALIRECRDAFRPGCIVTDVGSTKACVQREAEAALAGLPAVFIGSHPMAGSEKSGLEAARADLYDGAVTAVTPGICGDGPVVDRVCRLWRDVGAHVVRLDAAEHDALVARTSHLPHLLAALLVTVAGRDRADAVKAFCGSGFRDVTRVAAGSPEMWHDIVKTNRDALSEELRVFRRELDDLALMLEQGDYDRVKALLERGRTLRGDLIN
jgi:prephenate dehydrogenase